VRARVCGQNHTQLIAKSVESKHELRRVGAIETVHTVDPKDSCLVASRRMVFLIPITEQKRREEKEKRKKKKEKEKKDRKVKKQKNCQRMSKTTVMNARVWPQQGNSKERHDLGRP
jgi:hypothetical protein